MSLNKNIIDLENGNYTFSDYFKMNITAKELARIFGYGFIKDRIKFKQNTLSDEFIEWIDDFNKKLPKIQNRINLNSEMAKREFLISPIIYELVQNINIEVDIEADIYFDKTLKGKIDYVLNNENSIFIAIEAKNSNIEQGIIQLISELITIDKIIDKKNRYIYGAVTIGFTWCFVVLDRDNNMITQHLDYISIKDIDEIVRILVGILV